MLNVGFHGAFEVLQNISLQGSICHSQPFPLFQLTIPGLGIIITYINVENKKIVGSICMQWNEKVLNLMKKKNINQKQLSKLSGITKSSLSRYLNGDIVPRMDVIVNISKALQVETDYFLDDDEKTQSAYTTIATAIARKGSELSPEEKNQLIALLLGGGKDV